MTTKGEDAGKTDKRSESDGHQKIFGHLGVEPKDIIIGCGFAVIFGVAAVVIPEWLGPWFLFIGIATLAWPLARILQAQLKSKYPKAERWWFKWGVYLAWIVITFSVERLVYWHSIAVIAVEPNSAYPEQEVAVRGANFTRDHPNFMSASLKPLSGTDETVNAGIRNAEADTIDVKIPRGLSEGAYSLEVVGPLSFPLWSNRSAVTLTVLGAPQIDSIDPTSGIKPYGQPGTIVTIHGRNFDPRNDGRNNIVLFDTSSAPAHTCVGDNNCLLAAVPADAAEDRQVELSVEAGGRKSNPVKFHILGHPMIYGTSLEGKRGFPKTSTFLGSEIEVRGEGFVPGTEATRVFVGGREADVIAPVTENVIKFHIPANPEDGSVVVKTAPGQSAPVKQKIELLGPPIIFDFTPHLAHVGDVITITGENFDSDDRTSNHVMIGNAQATVKEVNKADDQFVLKAEVPEFAVDGDVVVGSPAVRQGEEGAHMPGFQLLPTIEAVVPSAAFVGDNIVVHGRGLLPDIGAKTANGVDMEKVSSPTPPSGNTAKFAVPAGAQSGNITATQGDNATATSPEPLRIARVDDLQKGDRVSNVVSFRNRNGVAVSLRADCDHNNLSVIATPPGSSTSIGVGRCPIDVDVDRANELAYVANYADHTVSVVDVSDPSNLRRVATIDTLGMDPTRVKVLRNGQVVVATRQGGVLYGRNRSVQDTFSGGFVKMISDQENGYVAIITTAGPGSPGTAHVAAVNGDGDGFRTVELGDDPTAAANLRYSNKIYVANHSSDSVSVLEMPAGKVLKTIPFPAHSQPFDLAQNASLPEMLVTETGRGVVGIINTRTDDLAPQEVKVGPEPKAISVSSSGCMAVVYDSQDHSLIRIDGKSHQTYGKPQLVRPDLSVREIRIADQEDTVLVLADGTATQPFPMPCPAQ